MIDSIDHSDLKKARLQLSPYFRACFVISGFLAILYLAPIGYMRDVFGPVINSRSLSNLAWVTVLLIFLLVITAFLDWIRQILCLKAAVKFSDQLIVRVFDATFSADILKLRESRSALSDLRVVRNFIASPMMGVIFDTPFGLLFLILVFFIHPTMGYLSLLGALLALTIGIWTERRVRPLMTKAIENANNSNAFITSSSRNTQSIFAMGMLKNLHNRWIAIQQQYLTQQAAASLEQAVGSATSKVVMAAQGSSLLGVGALLTLLGHLPPTASAYLIIAKLLGAMAVRPTMQLITGWKQVVVARESYIRLESFLERLPPRVKTMPMPPPLGHLIVSGAAARPPGTKLTTAHDLNFQLPPGQVLAIVGPSGSGKSSIARLLIGVWRPLVGSIRLDGVEISSWNKQELGPYIGYLPQDIELFEGTIAENISRFSELDDTKLQRAIKLSGIEDIIDSLEDGINSDIGEGGAILSGGQRQRVAIARAFYGEPKLIVMDEPNSNLDNKGEETLLNSIATLKQKGSTIILITHKKNILSVSDVMLVMNDGRPYLYGARDRVLQELAKIAETKPNLQQDL
jgi:ATP-binding cassette subfamily C exporter for protease/lipase